MEGERGGREGRKTVKVCVGFGKVGLCVFVEALLNDWLMR
jgi:hypothetical protein